MISYKLALLPVMPFSLGQITNGLKAMIEVGLFVFVFMFICLLLNNFVIEPMFRELK